MPQIEVFNDVSLFKKNGVSYPAWNSWDADLSSIHLKKYKMSRVGI
jgi:hypothetical protein